MLIEFSKLTGAGNDFVIVDNRHDFIPDPATLAKRLCDRRFGIGADGLILLQKSEIADYKMMYYNSDGSYGGMCGNGGRCIARFAVCKGIVPESHMFEALDFVYNVVIEGDSVSLQMKNPSQIEPVTLSFENNKLVLFKVNTGSPHIIIPVSLNKELFEDSINAVDVLQVGKKLRYHVCFSPVGTNVNFIVRDEKDHIWLRTYERGVEDETLACGTGSVAAAIVASSIWNIESPVRIMTHSKRIMSVIFTKTNGQYENVVLNGPAQLVFEGFIEFG
jgi:diaminopimelate epimerase